MAERSYTWVPALLAPRPLAETWASSCLQYLLNHSCPEIRVGKASSRPALVGDLPRPQGCEGSWKRQLSET